MCAVNRLTSEFFLCFPTTYLRKKDDSVKRRINATGVSKNIRTKSSYNANLLLEDMILNTCKL